MLKRLLERSVWSAGFSRNLSDDSPQRRNSELSLRPKAQLLPSSELR